MQKNAKKQVIELRAIKSRQFPW